MNFKSLLMGTSLLFSNLFPSGLSAETAPFASIASQAYPHEFFRGDTGFYYAFDVTPGLIWFLDEQGKFQMLGAYTIDDGSIPIIIGGQLELTVPGEFMVNQTQWTFPEEPDFPNSRSFFQNIIGQEISVASGDFLPVGAKFESAFTISTSQGEYYTWYPDERGLGLIITHLESNDKRYVSISEIKEVIGWTE